MANTIWQYFIQTHDFEIQKILYTCVVILRKIMKNTKLKKVNPTLKVAEEVKTTSYNDINLKNWKAL